MRRVVFSVPPQEVEPALDGLLPLLIRGVRGLGGGTMAADGVSLTRAQLEDAAGRPFTHFSEEELKGTAGHEESPVDVGGRLVVRSPGQPPPGDGRLDVVIERRGSAFGSGDHPTTRLSLALLCDLEPGDGLADLGCGLGTLAIAAARLGWRDVVGVDRDPESVELAIENAQRNGVDAELWVADLLESDIPYRSALLVNAPPDVHARVADGLPEDVRAVVASSFMAAEAEAVAEPYREKGLELVRAAEDGGWAALLLARPGVVEYGEVPAEADLVAGVEFAAPEEVKPAPLPAATLLDPDHVMHGGARFGQLASPLPDGGVAVSAARLVERGARAAILYLPGLFRFDLMPGREAFSVSLRELCDAPMRWEADADTVDGFRREKSEPLVFRGGIQLPDARLSIGLQALSAADEDQGAVHVVATAAVRVV
jgi:ribosomal protein L11 methyltransferase